MRWAWLLCVLGACGRETVPDLHPDAQVSEPDAMICELAPREIECCFDDADCDKDLRCFTAACVVDGEGRCEPPAEPGACWVDADCQPSQTCEGEQICPCTLRCLQPDSPGTCQP